MTAKAAAGAAEASSYNSATPLLRNSSALLRAALDNGGPLVTICQVETPDDVRDVQALLREYTAWAFTLDAHSHRAPTFEGLEEELSSLPGIYAPPAGRLLLARQDGRAAGCVALIGRQGDAGELKRLYVRPDCRGERIGRRLVEALIGEAREIGYRRLVLNSHATMEAAHAIYEGAGFRRVETPDDFPAEMKPVVVFMEMEL